MSKAIIMKEVEVDVCDVCDIQDIEVDTVPLEWNGEKFHIDACVPCREMIESTFDSWISVLLKPSVEKRKGPGKTRAKAKAKSKRGGGTGGRLKHTTTSGRSSYAANQEAKKILKDAGFAPHFGARTPEEKKVLEDAGWKP